MHKSSSFREHWLLLRNILFSNNRVDTNVGFLMFVHSQNHFQSAYTNYEPSKKWACAYNAIPYMPLM